MKKLSIVLLIAAAACMQACAKLPVDDLVKPGLLVVSCKACQVELVTPFQTKTYAASIGAGDAYFKYDAGSMVRVSITADGAQPIGARLFDRVNIQQHQLRDTLVQAGSTIRFTYQFKAK